MAWVVDPGRSKEMEAILKSIVCFMFASDYDMDSGSVVRATPVQQRQSLGISNDDYLCVAERNHFFINKVCVIQYGNKNALFPSETVCWKIRKL